MVVRDLKRLATKEWLATRAFPTSTLLKVIRKAVKPSTEDAGLAFQDALHHVSVVLSAHTVAD
jgi:hypothetical protein